MPDNCAERRPGRHCAGLLPVSSAAAAVNFLEPDPMRGPIIATRAKASRRRRLHEDRQWRCRASDVITTGSPRREYAYTLAARPLTFQGCFWNTMVPVTTPLEFEVATDTCKKAPSSMQ